MTNRDLENLKDLATSQPRSGAKRAAMAAALAEFDNTSALPTPQEGSRPEAPAQNSSKGNVVPLRQTETSNAKRSFRMYLSSRSSQAIAASVAAMVIAAPFAFQHMQTLRDAKPTFNSVGTEIQSGKPARIGPPRIADAQPESSVYASSGPKLTVGVNGKTNAPANVPSTVAAQPEPRVAEARQAFGGETKLKGEVGQVAKKIEQNLGSSASAPAATTTTKQPHNPIADELAAAAAQAQRNGYVRPLQPGLQEQYSDNTHILVDRPAASPPPPATTPAEGKVADVTPPAPPPMGSRDGLGAVGGYAGLTSRRGNAAQSAAAEAPRADLNAELGKRILERDASVPAVSDPSKPNPYAWMGRVEQQKAIVLEENRDKFDAKEINPVKQVASEPVSTFSIDVDTASYSFVRRALNSGHLPPKDAVRVEEMINYFPYAYPAPDSAETPFKPTVTVLPSPWNVNNKLVHVAIKGYDLKSTERPRANIVLLMDVSGSMAPEDRLPLVKNAFRMLVNQLKPDDTVGIVTYASGSGIALEPTKVSDKGRILAAIEGLGAGGSTAGAAGISDAYRLAEAGFAKSAVNRIILATDGDFNVGITDQSELKSYIERKRQSGIFLSILGVGQGNHNDALMQTLAQNGNGTAAYVDTLNEARKVLVDESSSTLFTIAKDVKLQIEWNPQAVAEYRLIGYETRNLRREDFSNDRVDAGDIGSGHTVTAIYEVTPIGAPQLADDLRYGKVAAKPVIRESDANDTKPGELGFLKLRYKRPNEDVSQLISLPIADQATKRIDDASSTDVRFSVAVSAFAQLLKSEPYTQGYNYDDVLTLAQGARGDDPFGYRAEFLNLVRLTKSARE